MSLLIWLIWVFDIVFMLLFLWVVLMNFNEVYVLRDRIIYLFFKYI